MISTTEMFHEVFDVNQGREGRHVSRSGIALQVIRGAREGATPTYSVTDTFIISLDSCHACADILCDLTMLPSQTSSYTTHLIFLFNFKIKVGLCPLGRKHTPQCKKRPRQNLLQSHI